MLQTLFSVARVHGTEVRLIPVAVPAHWNGRVLKGGPDAAALLEAQADRGRRLGHLPLA
ncbi:hypothetical protein [Streptomyces sp. NBC_00645]|uniref:hypothetical protein n=1 Tax=Streptomyces sp. NBC_00645 TaxID=2975795 RepID=UPI003252D1EA